MWRWRRYVTAVGCCWCEMGNVRSGCSLQFVLDGVYVGVLLYWGVIFPRLGIAKAVGKSYFCIGYLFHLIEV